MEIFANLSPLSSSVFHTVRDTRAVLSVLGESNPLGRLPLSWDMCSSPAESVQWLHSHLSADSHFDQWIARTFQLYPPLRVTFAVPWQYAGTKMGMNITWLSPGTQEGRESYGTRTPQCIGNMTVLLAPEANPKEQRGTAGGQRREDVYFLACLYYFLKVTQPQPQTHTSLHLREERLNPLIKGKHFALHAVCAPKWMLFWITKSDQM